MSSGQLIDVVGMDGRSITASSGVISDGAVFLACMSPGCRQAGEKHGGNRIVRIPIDRLKNGPGLTNFAYHYFKHHDGKAHRCGIKRRRGMFAVSLAVAKEHDLGRRETKEMAKHNSRRIAQITTLPASHLGVHPLQ